MKRSAFLILALLMGCDEAAGELGTHRDAPVRTNPVESMGITLTNGTAFDGKVWMPDLEGPDDAFCSVSGLDPLNFSCHWADCDEEVGTVVAFPPEGTEIRVEVFDPCGVAL